MKKLLFSLAFLFSVAFASSSIVSLNVFAEAVSSSDGKLELIPEYDESLSIPFGSCSCVSIFVSCSQQCDGSNCTCTCSAFSCVCSPCEQLNPRTPITGIIDLHETEPISVSRSQYENFEKLAVIIASKQSDESRKALNTLNGMINYLKDKDFGNYRVLADQFVVTLSELSENQKHEINNFLESNGSNTRV